MERYHLVISTGQNVANLIPLLELAKLEEPIIILSSSYAEKSGLSQRLQNVLSEHGYYRINKLPISDSDILNFHKLKKKVAQYFHDASHLGEIYFYLNGGQKIAALATWSALVNLPVKFIYMDSKPIQISVVELQKTVYRPIQRSIRLQEILEINNSHIAKGQKIYAEGRFQYKPRFSEKVTAFGKNEKFSFALLDLIQKLNEKDTKEENPLENKNYFRWLKKRILPTRDERIMVIKNDINNLIKATTKLKGQSDSKAKESIEKRVKKINNKLEDLVNWAVSLPKNNYNQYLQYKKKPIILNEEERRFFREYGLTFERNVKSFPFGNFFEIVTTWRLIHFLQANPIFLKIISEIWINVEFEAKENPGKATGEYDILILLKNGLLIALECKTFDFEEKDLFARISRLMRRGGLLSEFWVILPVFTNEQFRNLLKKQYNLYAKLKDLGMTIVPFTLPNQPPNLVLSETKQEFEIKQFEDELTLLLKRFFSLGIENEVIGFT